MLALVVYVVELGKIKILQLNLVSVHPTVRCVRHQLVLAETSMHETGNETRRQVRFRRIVLHLSRSSYQPAFVDILRMHRLEYIEFSSEDLKVTGHVAVAEDRLDVFGVVFVTLRLQVLALFKVLFRILQSPLLVRQNAILNGINMIHFVKLRISDIRGQGTQKNSPIVIFFYDHSVTNDNKHVYL